MSTIHTNIGLPVFGGVVRPESVLVRHKTPATGSFGAELGPKVRAVAMRT
jgi:hypothetical protein